MFQQWSGGSTPPPGTTSPLERSSSPRRSLLHRTPIRLGLGEHGFVGPARGMAPVADSGAPGGGPSVGALLAANLKVLAVVALLAGGAFLVWKGLAALFPEQAWLQGPAG